jgi:hypothetical protein
VSQIHLAAAIALATTLAASGCVRFVDVSEHDADTDADADADTDTDTDTDTDADTDDTEPDADEAGPAWETVASEHQPGPHVVDLLLVVDNSNGMADEQDHFVGQLAPIVQRLVNPTEPTAPVVADLHVGVVSTDLGGGGYSVATCADAHGDDGELQAEGRGGGCAASYEAADCADPPRCPWLAHGPGHPDRGDDGSEPIWDDAACIAGLGTGGCGFERPLEAARRLLVDHTAAGGRHEGFLRGDSLLAVVFVSDEDDCSVADASLVDPEDEDLGPLTLRCAMHEEYLRDVEALSGAIAGLRADRNDIVMVAIAGFPTDRSTWTTDPVGTLRDLRSVDPFNVNSLVPSCVHLERGTAFPPVRLAEMVLEFGTADNMVSICEEDWSRAGDAVAERLGSRLIALCVPRVEAGTCRLVETLPVGAVRCPDPADVDGPSRMIGSRADLGVDAAGRRRCEILPADYDGDGNCDGAAACELPGALNGWVYDDFDGSCAERRVKLTTTAIPVAGSDVAFECLVD